MRVLRVCHVTSAGGWGKPQFGGAERGVRDLIRHVDRTRYAITLVCPGYAAGWYRDEIDDVVIDGPSRRVDLGYIVRLARLFRERRFDVVHLHLLAPTIHGRLAARAAGRRAVVTDLHNSLLSLSQMATSRVESGKFAVYRTLDRFGANHLTTVAIAISDAVAEDMRKQGIAPSRIRVVENWVDPVQFGPRDDAQRALDRIALGVPASQPTLALIGRLEPEKQFALVLRALEEHSRWRALVCGSGRDEAMLRSIVRDLGLAGRVDFLGHRTDVEMVMGAADLVCLPSRVDGFGRVAVEALSVGTPVLAHQVDGLRTVLSGLPGVRWTAPSVSSWASALAAAEDWRVDRTVTARAVADRYGMRRSIQLYEGLYDSVASGAAG